MTDNHEVLLSILIPTLVAREPSFARLQGELEEQIRTTHSTGLVEVLTLSDDGIASIGAKRNRLTEQSRGRFVVFIDDDDSISGDYIRLILQAIRENEQADCICFAGEIMFRGKHSRKLLHSIENKDWQYARGDYVRPPCHITPIRRDIAIRYRFANRSVAEDMEWTLRMSNDGALREEVVLDEVLYFYDCRRAFAKQWALDRTQALRHKLGLRFTTGKSRKRRNSGKPSLLFVSNNLIAYGGGNCVIAWALMALREHWDITLLCPRTPDFEPINRHFGTSLSRDDFIFRELPSMFNFVSGLDPDPFSVQRLAMLMRVCQAESHLYDAVMTCDDEVDFGRPGIQYTHYPHMQHHNDALEFADSLTQGQKLRAFLTGKLRPWLWISGISLKRIRSNLMVTNSNWTADVLRTTYDVEPVVVYPPVLWDGPQVPYAKRRNAFACIGRLSPTKRYPEIIGIIAKVRARGFDVELDIIGDEDMIAGDDHVQEIRQLIDDAGGWVRLHKSVKREELERLVSRSRFGIHGMLDEHFGIAPAELMRGGCVVFVPNNGGQVEIVGEHPELRYDSDDDAVEKICRVLADEEAQVRLRKALDQRSELLGEEHFMEQIRDVVGGFEARFKSQGP